MTASCSYDLKAKAAETRPKRVLCYSEGIKFRGKPQGTVSHRDELSCQGVEVPKDGRSLIKNVHLSVFCKNFGCLSTS